MVRCTASNIPRNPQLTKNLDLLNLRHLMQDSYIIQGRSSKFCDNAAKT